MGTVRLQQLTPSTYSAPGSIERPRISPSQRPVSLRADLLVQLSRLLPGPRGDRNEPRGEQGPDDTCAATDRPRKQPRDHSEPRPPRPQRTTASASHSSEAGTVPQTLAGANSSSGPGARAEPHVTVIITLSS